MGIAPGIGVGKGWSRDFLGFGSVELGRLRQWADGYSRN